jgi:hypothetical protein
MESAADLAQARLGLQLLLRAYLPAVEQELSKLQEAKGLAEQVEPQALGDRAASLDIVATEQREHCNLDQLRPRLLDPTVHGFLVRAA